MRKFFYLLPIILLSGCSGQKSNERDGSQSGSDMDVDIMSEDVVQQSISDVSWSEENLPLPVSKSQIVKDWTLASYSGYSQEELPYSYKCIDLDLDGNPEVLLFAENNIGGPRAILFYQNGVLNDYCYESDGYNTFSVGKPQKGKGIFVNMHDDHMNESRCWYSMYYVVENSKLRSVGDSYIQTIYEEGMEEYEYEEGGEVPADIKSIEVVEFEYLQNWLPLNLTAEERQAAVHVGQNDNDSFSLLKEMREKDMMTYQGKIGPYPITMLIKLDLVDEEWVGCYYYDSRPNSVFKLKAIENQSSPEGWSDVVLEEYTTNGNMSGTFKGRLDGRGDGFEGEFCNSRGKKFTFELHQTQ